MNRKHYLVIILLAFMQLVSAQTADHKLAFGINGISTKYVGDLGGNAVTDFTFSQYVLGYFSGGLSLNYYLNPSFDLGVNGSYGLYGAYHSHTKKFISTKLSSTLFAHYKLNNGYIFSEKSKWSPFLSLGFGVAKYGEVEDYPGWADYSGMDLIVPVGVGLKFQITDAFALQYQYNYNFTNGDKRDKVVAGGNDAYGEHLLGVVFSLGKNKDSDKDGIADKYDMCPNTPANVPVDAKGCPIDTDGDGVADYLDKCPCTPVGAVVDVNGCPIDSDGDGIPDFFDKCPNTPANVQVDASGCPIDSDGDGVADYLDKCPCTPKGIAVDKDGCPFDRDGDGVPDYLDKCPDVKGSVGNNGCPGVSPEAENAFYEALRGVQFEFDSSKITEASNPILDNVVNVLKKNPDYTVVLVNGHTDSVGSDKYNLKLSQERADAVKKYLVDNGISASRLTSKGFGESLPVATNDTEEGRHQNRRVDIRVIF